MTARESTKKKWRNKQGAGPHSITDMNPHRERDRRRWKKGKQKGFQADGYVESCTEALGSHKKGNQFCRKAGHGKRPGRGGRYFGKKFSALITFVRFKRQKKTAQTERRKGLLWTRQTQTSKKNHCDPLEKKPKKKGKRAVKRGQTESSQKN